MAKLDSWPVLTSRLEVSNLATQQKNNIYFISNILSAVCDERVDADVCYLFRLKLSQFEAFGPDIGKKR